VSTNPASFLAIGNVTTDLWEGGPALGGAALYAAVQARALGLRARVLTAAGREWPGRKILRSLEARILESAATTTFEYAPGPARVSARAGSLNPSELPEGWAASEIALLCPVLDEVDPAFALALSPRILGVAPQGWLRALDAQGRVVPARWDGAARVVERAAAVFLSDADAPDTDDLARGWAERTAVAVVTRGARGATLYTAGRRVDVASVQAREVDPTGAGDVYAASFLVARFEGASLEEAAHFAAAAAACAVEAPGIAGIRGRSVIEARARASPSA
jgi:sugar/nucleoside kinase (ribokinase family)